jgi:tRNA (cytidine/uridine-2'-O-)-methyltransferase
MTSTPFVMKVDAAYPSGWCRAGNPPKTNKVNMTLRLALFQPDIPQNAGTMLRLCACMGVGAAIIEPASFPVSDRAFRRAGMDYLDRIDIDRHISFAAFEAWRAETGQRLVLLTTRATVPHTKFAFELDDILLVGRESAGVPDVVHEAADARIIVPMRPALRSLNVAMAASMVLGEALRQTGGFSDLVPAG